MKLKRYRDSKASFPAYRSENERYQVEKDYSLQEWDSLQEWGEPTEFSWFVYRVADIERGLVGPPDAIYEAATLGEVRAWLDNEASNK